MAEVDSTAESALSIGERRRMLAERVCVWCRQVIPALGGVYDGELLVLTHFSADCGSQVAALKGNRDRRRPTDEVLALLAEHAARKAA